MHYAIDFGTSNTVIACRMDGQGEAVGSQINTVTLPFSAVILDNPPLIPSLVYVTNAATGEVLVGQEVLDQGLEGSEGHRSGRLFRGFKRGISSPGGYGFVPQVDDIDVSFAQVGEWFLSRVLSELTEVESLTLTVPVDSFEAYRQWLTHTCQRLPHLENVKQIRLLDEPTAAALGYGIDRGNQTLLVIDFGGGTLDLSLVRLSLPEPSERNGSNTSSNTPSSNTPSKNDKPSNKPKFGLGTLLKWGDRATVETSPSRQAQPTAKVLAKAGQNLGGIDVDHWLMDYFQQQMEIPQNALTMRLVEKLKIALSHEPSPTEFHTETYFDDVSFNAYDLRLNQDELNGILEKAGFRDSLDQSLNQIRQQAQRQNIELSSIDAVLLVGGTSQMPAVQAWIEQYFPPEKIKKNQPFTAIAQGALSQEFALEDFLYHSYGIRFWDKRYKRHNWHTIIQQGQTYPLAQPVELTLGASVPNQPSIELVIGELGETTVEVYFENGKLLTRHLDQLQQSVRPLNENARTIAELAPPGRQGVDRIKVEFTVDESRTLRITVKDLLTTEVLLQDQAVVQLV